MASSKDPQKLHDRKKKEKQTALLWRLRARAPVQKIYLGTTSAEVDDNKDGPKRQELLGASIWRRIMMNLAGSEAAQSAVARQITAVP